MNQQRTRILKKKAARIFLTAAVGLLILNSAASAQDTLGSLMEQTGSEFIVGKWTGVSPDGQEFMMEFKWEIKPPMNGHIGSSGQYSDIRPHQVS